nr:MBL fold metallo-hydrolase [Lysinibacillus timonensis]
MFEKYQKGKKRVYPIIYKEQYGNLSSVNCYLYDNGITLTLIDAGLRTDNFLEFFHYNLKQYHLSIQDIDQIFLTHHHDDHIGLVNELLKVKRIAVYAHYLAIPRILFDENYLKNKYNFFLKIYEEYGCLDIASQRFKTMEQTLLNREQLRLQTEVFPLHNGDVLDEMTVMEVLGHSPDSIIFYEPSLKWQFSGDLVLENATTNALIDFNEELQLLPTVSQYQQSLIHCRELETEWMFPGHQNPFQQHELEIGKKLNRIERKEKRIIEAVAKGHQDTLSIAYALYGKKVEIITSLVLSEVIGYLEFAVARGNLSKTKVNSQWKFEA